jgi:hypothetical protein
MAKTYAALSGVDGTVGAALTAAQSAFASSESIQALSRAVRLPAALEGAYADILRASTPSNAVLDLVREAGRQTVPLPNNYLDSIAASIPAYESAQQALAASAPSWTSLPAFASAREALAASAPSWTSILTEQARLMNATRAPLGIPALAPVLTTRAPIPATPALAPAPPDTTVPDLLTDVSNHLANIVARTDADAQAAAIDRKAAAEAATKARDSDIRRGWIMLLLGILGGGVMGAIVAAAFAQQ